MKIFDEFKAFAMKGNVADMAVGIIIGAAFGKIVNSAVSDVLMPPLGYLIGGVDFSALEWTFKPAILTASAVSIKYGLFINAVISFIIVAFATFLLIRAMNSLRVKEEAKPSLPRVPSHEEVLLTEIRDLLKKK
jgi:large conductance mechanosensitive channel